MDIKNFVSAISQIAEKKGISEEKVVESFEAALAAAYKKEYGKKGQIIKAKIDSKTGKFNFWQIKTVVSKDMLYTDEELEELKEKKKDEDEESNLKEGSYKIRFNPERHILIEDAKKINPKAEINDEIEIPLETKENFGRIASQTAKQVILQKLREAERETILNEYKSKEGEIISGVVQRIEGRNVFVDIGKTLGILPKEEQVRGEFYRPGQRLKFYVLKIEDSSKGPVIILSRAYPKLVSKLFELEVPEINQGVVVIKAIAREPGFRSKIALESKEKEIDPIGSAVGQKGVRVMAVINELGGEKIDVIEYSDDPKKFIANALSPAKVLDVKILPKNRALCIVDENQLSLAIGKDGQNVRLASKLTGWNIDVKALGDKDIEEIEEEFKEEEIDNEEENEEVKEKKEKKIRKTKEKKTKKEDKNNKKDEENKTESENEDNNKNGIRNEKE